MILLLLSCSQARMEHLWQTARLWRAGENVARVDAARDSLKRCPQAVSWLFRTKIYEKDRFGIRAIRDMFMGNYARTLPYLKEVLLSTKIQGVKNALYLIREWRVKELGDVLWQIIPRYDDRPSMLSNIIYGIGLSGDSTLAKYIADFLEHPDELIRYRTIQALGRMHAYQYIPSIIMHLDDEHAFVRYESCRVLYSWRDKSFEQVEKFARNSIGSGRFRLFLMYTLRGMCDSQ